MFDGLPPVAPEAVAPTQTAQPEQPQTPPQAPETPAVETPTVTPTEPTPPVFNFSEMFEGKYQSVDEVKKSLQDYEARVKELETREPEFANEDLRYINYALKAGLDESKARVLKSVKDGTLTDPKDIVTAKLQIQYGWDKQKAENYVNRTYKLGEEYDLEDSEVQAARDQLEMQSVMDKTFLSEQADKVQVPQKVDYQSIVQQQLETWKPVIPTLVKDNSVISIADGINYNVPQETLASVEKYVTEVLGMEAGYDPKNHSKEVSELINKEIWWKERSNILTHVQTEMEKKSIREKANVPPPSGTQTVPSGNKELDATKDVLRQMAEERNQGW